ncbi:MAG: ATP-binding protein [bacterium]|nr:ATP-binding protein [bacterium]
MYTSQSLLEQNRLLTEEVKRRVDQIAAINMVAATVSNSLDLSLTLNTALQAVVDVVGAEAAGISLIDEQVGEIVLRAQLGWIQDLVVGNPMRIPLGRGMSGLVISSDDVVVYNNLTGREDYAFPPFSNERFQSIAMAPMHARGKIIGILSIMSDQANRFNEDVVNVLRAVADTVGVALDNAKLYADSVEQQERLSAILESTADGIIATDQTSRISLVNHAAEVMLEVPKDTLEGLPLREAPMHPTMRDSLLLALSSRTEAREKIFQVTMESGRVLSVAVSPVYVENQIDQDAETDGWVIVLQDVTHLREAEIARAQFMQAAAHDMRNPLSVTQSSLGILQDIIGTDPTAQEVIEIAMGGVKRLQSLIDDLLHLEHIESGYNFVRSAINLGETMQEVSKEISPLMRQKSLRYSVELADDLPPAIMADMRWIKRALHNYLENASKYTPEGGTVLLRAYRDGDMLHLEVTDNGPGIPLNAQPRLFERFYRVNDNSKIKGTGLGLAIVKSVAEAHGGTVYVRSKPGQGSTFGLTIPH